MIGYLCQYSKLTLSMDELWSWCLKVQPESRCQGGKEVCTAVLQVTILKSTRLSYDHRRYERDTAARSQVQTLLKS